MFLKTSIPFFILVLASCTESKRPGADTYSYYLETIEEIKIGVDDMTDIKSNLFQVFQSENIEILAVENKYKNGLDFYSLQDYKFISDIRFNKEGPNAVKSIHGFYALNKDSIYVFEENTLSNIKIVNMDGEIISEVKAKHPFRDGPLFNHASMTRLPPLLIERKLIFFEFPYVNLADPSVFNQNINLEFSLDIESFELSRVGYSWPEIYHGKNWGSILVFPSRNIGKNNTIVYSWAADPEIQVLDLSNGIKKYLAASDLFDYPSPSPFPISTYEDSRKYYIESPYYGSVIWDPHNRLYYRFAIQGMKYLDEKTANPSNGEDKPVSIIILNEELKKVGETPLLPTNKFYPRDWFICSKGLFISNSHYSNPSLSEENMSFTRFQVKKKDETL